MFSAQLLEAINMVAESIDPAIIEQAALQAGYAVAPLQLADELNFETIRKIMDETIEAARNEGAELDESVPVAGEVIATMIDEFERTGKHAGAGFYDYADGKRTGLWSGVRQEWKSRRELSVPFSDLEDRLLFIQVIETQ